MKISKTTGLMSLIFTIVFMGFGSSIAQAATYTMADVATHNTPANCWVVVNNNVYNLTDFINSHSGGSSVIKAQCGKNGTASFNNGPHSASTLNAISSSLLGSLVVVTPILTSMTVVPSSPTIIVGGNIHLNTTLKDQNGNKITGTTTTFSSSNTAIATVGSTSGTVTGVAIGTATITATATKGAVTITKTSTVTVSATAPTVILDSVKITPASPSVKISKTVQLSAITKDQNGKKFTGATTTFKSSDSDIATVDSDTGLVTGVALGSVTITATSTYGNEEVTGTAVVKVVNTTINQDDNGEHLGQYKYWFEKWFEKWEKKWEKRHNEREENDNWKNQQNDRENNDNDDKDEEDD